MTPELVAAYERAFKGGVEAQAISGDPFNEDALNRSILTRFLSDATVVEEIGFAIMQTEGEGPHWGGAWFTEERAEAVLARLRGDV